MRPIRMLVAIFLLAGAGAVAPRAADDGRVAPFTIHVADADLADLNERLARTRFPDEIPGADWSYGTSRGYLESLVRYWRDGFDWRAQERALNRFEQFTTQIDGITLHFIRIYYETAHSTTAPAARRIETPTACADFPKEPIWSPRKWMERRYNITRWTEMPRGGHFAAFEQPALFVDDVRAFFRGLRSTPAR